MMFTLMLRTEWRQSYYHFFKHMCKSISAGNAPLFPFNPQRWLRLKIRQHILIHQKFYQRKIISNLKMISLSSPGCPDRNPTGLWTTNPQTFSQCLSAVPCFVLFYTRNSRSFISKKIFPCTPRGWNFCRSRSYFDHHVLNYESAG